MITRMNTHIFVLEASIVQQPIRTFIFVLLVRMLSEKQVLNSHKET